MILSESDFHIYIFIIFLYTAGENADKQCRYSLFPVPTYTWNTYIYTHARTGKHKEQAHTRTH